MESYLEEHIKIRIPSFDGITREHKGLILINFDVIVLIFNYAKLGRIINFDDLNSVEIGVGMDARRIVPDF